MSNTFRKKKKVAKSSSGTEVKASAQPIFNFKMGSGQSSLIVGVVLLAISVFLSIAFFSYLFNGQADQDLVQNRISDSISNDNRQVSNSLGLFGAYTSHWFIFNWFGIAAFGLIPILFLSGFRLVFRQDLFELNLNRLAIGTVFYVLFCSILLGYFVLLFEFNDSFVAGGIGFQVNQFFYKILGWGSIILIALILFLWLVFFHGLTKIDDYFLGYDAKTKKKYVSKDTFEEDEDLEDEFETPINKEVSKNTPFEFTLKSEVLDQDEPLPSKQIDKEPFKGGIEFTVEKVEEPEIELEIADETEGSLNFDDDNDQLLSEFGPYDPKLDLAAYQYPTLNLLNEHTSVSGKVSGDELEANKNKIVETMNNFQIGISSIKATIGPTVTLYEIVPEAGVRISKIKNLEDDIALNLAALGIRIIAPMPGKGTIGIEVPNKNPEMVSIRSVLSSEKFQKSTYELPIVLGKNIANEIFISDLAKMPHLLMAGATGQGKSVGLNVILASLLYKKHPSEVKFVLVDPKKVELSLFNKIERHFLAMLPNAEEAIITDTKKVIYTLNSLCIEMDNRYNLLKEAGVRNIREYNAKFTRRKLNPEKGHKFLPYIVLVIDELADLMMTAGKEVEQPIARLAQLARAIGIHLIVATQRPSVNVITGLIKANFPARLSFKVTAKVDSRTILDTGGSEQLVGNGDMLLSMGSDMIRLQCPFVDTPEVEGVCEFIGSQRGYESAYLLPEFFGDDEPDGLDFDPRELDPLFDDAARLLVNHQQGSTSLIQRKMKLGYNRAGRIIDQLEGANIVGPFEGSKAREVLVKDLQHLEEILRSLQRD
jgi:DNA segregation ATPase FtsK/SpoIIIE, S-DNA-T family